MKSTFCTVIFSIMIVLSNYSTLLSQNMKLERDTTFTITLGKGFENMTCHLTVLIPYDELKDSTIYNMDFYAFSDSSFNISFCDTMYFIRAFPEFIDLNFDGYQDIRLFRESSNGIPTFWKNAWLFDKERKSFTYSKSFSELPDEIKLDKKKKNISYDYINFYGSGGERVYGTKKFSVICNELCEIYNIENDETSIDSFNNIRTAKSTEIYNYYNNIDNKPVLYKIKEVIENTYKNKSIIETTVKVRDGKDFKVISHKKKTKNAT